MTDVVTSSTSGNHQEQHTDDSSQDADGATDTTPSEFEGGNGLSRGDLNDRNPEPPAELLEERILDAGNIGGTMFSKHWLFTTLMKLIQVSYEYDHFILTWFRGCPGAKYALFLIVRTQEPMFHKVLVARTFTHECMLDCSIVVIRSLFRLARVLTRVASTVKSWHISPPPTHLPILLTFF